MTYSCHTQDCWPPQDQPTVLAQPSSRNCTAAYSSASTKRPLQCSPWTHLFSDLCFSTHRRDGHSSTSRDKGKEWLELLTSECMNSWPCHQALVDSSATQRPRPWAFDNASRGFPCGLPTNWAIVSWRPRRGRPYLDYHSSNKSPSTLLPFMRFYFFLTLFRVMYSNLTTPGPLWFVQLFSPAQCFLVDQPCSHYCRVAFTTEWAGGP